MHLIHVINAFSAGGAEVLVRGMASRLRNLGHRVDVVALFPSQDGTNERKFEENFRQKLEILGVGTHVVAGENVPLWQRSFKMSRLIKEIAPDIIHVHLARALLLLLPSWSRGLIVVYTHHNVRFNFPPWLFVVFNRIVSRYVAISDICLRALEKAGAAPIQLIRNGADLPNGEARTLGSEPHRLISVGGLTQQKSFDTLLEAMHKLNSEANGVPRFLLDIVGNGSQRAQLERICDTLSLGGTVNFLGTRDDVPKLLAIADVYVNSSSFEGLSISLLEAGGAGLPVVATAVGGTPEIIVPETNGELVPPGDSEALAEGIKRIVADPVAYARMSCGALQNVTMFTMEACVDNHMELYRELLSVSDISEAG